MRHFAECMNGCAWPAGGKGGRAGAVQCGFHSVHSFLSDVFSRGDPPDPVGNWIST